jgi:PAS domain S-box-containing protein
VGGKASVYRGRPIAPLFSPASANSANSISNHMRSIHDWFQSGATAGNGVQGADRAHDGAIDQVLWAGALGVIYALVSALSNEFSAASAAPAPLWISDGVALALVLLAPARAHPAMYAAILLANIIVSLLAGVGLVATLVGSVANTLQTLIAVSAIRRITGLPVRLLNLRALVTFYVAAVLIATALAAAVQAAGAAVLLQRDFREDFITIYVSDALGVALITPMLVSWGLFYAAIRDGRIAPLPFQPWRFLEGVIAFSGVVISAWLVFATDFNQLHAIRPFVYLNLPCLVWVALRFDLRAVTAALVITALIGAYYTMQGLGQFAIASAAIPLQTALLELQAFLMVLSITVMVVAGLFNEERVVSSELKSLRRRYGAVMRASGNVAFEIDLASRRVVWLGDTEAVLGWRAEDISTVAAWNEKVHPDDLDRLVGVRQRLSQGDGTQESLEYRIFKPDGSVIRLGIGAYGASDFDARRRQTRRLIVGMAKDITAIARLAEENRQLDANLRQAQKMESIGQLAGGIAHDFNNILAAILGYGEMARSKLGTPELVADRDSISKLARYVDTILKAAERGRALVAQILTFSRRAPEKRVPVDVGSVVSEVVSLLRGSFSVQIVFDPEARDLAVLGDATALHQLVMNVSTNGIHAIEARAATSPGFTGALSILLARETLDTSPADAGRTLAAGPYAVLRIADDGIGIAPDVRERMFDPFFTTKSVGRGTGLGLSLARAVAEAHGGAVTCSSTVGHGTTFTIYLPLVPEAADSHEATARDRVATRGGGQRIMLVDDDDALRALATELVAELGYQPEAFASAMDAWAAFEAAPDNWDAILSDEVMPGMTGTALAAQVHARRPALPVIIITAYGGAGFQLRAEEAGVARVLKKPYRREDVAEALAAALRVAR